MLEFLQSSVREFGRTVVLVTHDPDAAPYSDRVIFLADHATGSPSPLGISPSAAGRRVAA